MMSYLYLTYSNAYDGVKNILFNMYDSIVNKDTIEIGIKSWHSKFFFFFTFSFGVISLYRYLKNSQIISYLKNIIIYFPMLNPNNFCIIYYFSDSEPGFTITEYLIKKGYNLILITSEKMQDFRKDHLELQNILNNNKERVHCFTESEISKEIIKELIGNSKIDYIFDTSIYRHFLSNEEINTENYKLDFFQYDELTNSLGKYYQFMECIKTFINDTTFYLLNYIDKHDDLNYRVLYDMKIGYLINFATVYKDNIHLKLIKLINENKTSPFCERDINRIIKFSKIKDLKELSFA